MGQWKMVREMIDVYSSCQVLFCTDLVKCLWVNGRCYGSYWLCTIYGRWEMQFCILAKSLLKKDCYWVTCCDLIGVGIYIYILAVWCSLIGLLLVFWVVWVLLFVALLVFIQATCSAVVVLQVLVLLFLCSLL